jgi:Fic family protein
LTIKPQAPDGIAVTSDLQAILGDVLEELNRLRSLGEFPAEVREEIRRAFLPERISDTLNMEGIRVNPRVTRAVLEGLSLSETDKYNEREILNVIEANDFVETLAHSSDALTSKVVREIHERVMQDLMDDPGAFRQEDVKITGASFTPPHFGDVPEFIRQMCEAYENFLSENPTEHPIVGAAWLHGSFTAIHPFKDGNGRVGRLLQDYALMRGGLLPVGVPVGRRTEYYDALSGADGGDWKGLIAIIADAQLTALDRARAIAEAPAQRREGIKKLLRLTQTTKLKRDYREYEVWRRRLDTIREEFQRWAEELNDEADQFAVRTKVWDPISFEKWSEIRSKGWSSGTWVFTLTFFVERQRTYSALFYARRHEWGFCLEYDESLHRAVGLFLAGAPEGLGQFDFDKFADPYIRLRELIYDDEGCLIAYRDPKAAETKESELPEVVGLDVQDGKWVAEYKASVPAVVEEFLADMLVKLGLAE